MLMGCFGLSLAPPNGEAREGGLEGSLRRAQGDRIPVAELNHSQEGQDSLISVSCYSTEHHGIIRDSIAKH